VCGNDDDELPKIVAVFTDPRYCSRERGGGREGASENEREMDRVTTSF